MSGTEISHRFTVVGLQALFQVQMVLPSEHTAGTPMPEQGEITPHILINNDVTYEFSPITWSVIPGHVVIRDNALYELENGCIYEFPTPLFEYDVVP